jgi:hypothetical protein
MYPGVRALLLQVVEDVLESYEEHVAACSAPNPPPPMEAHREKSVEPLASRPITRRLRMNDNRSGSISACAATIMRERPAQYPGIRDLVSFDLVEGDLEFPR